MVQCGTLRLIPLPSAIITPALARIYKKVGKTTAKRWGMAEPELVLGFAKSDPPGSPRDFWHRLKKGVESQKRERGECKE